MYALHALRSSNGNAFGSIFSELETLSSICPILFNFFGHGKYSYLHSLLCTITLTSFVLNDESGRSLLNSIE